MTVYTFAKVALRIIFDYITEKVHCFVCKTTNFNFKKLYHMFPLL